MSKRPVIGVTLDHEEAGGYSKFPWYALRENYAGCLIEKGALPLILPHDPETVEDYASMLDGLVITGGAFDVPPHMFGESTVHDTVLVKQRRTAFEVAITKSMLERDRPVLGICGGQQLLNVMLGGTLIQHIPDSVPEALAHEQPNPRDEAGHDVTIEPGTLLHEVTGLSSMPVNSAHHQAAADVGKDVVVSARASDGVIEAIEHPGYRYCLGVQWHPEFFISPGDHAVIDSFVKVSSS